MGIKIGFTPAASRSIPPYLLEVLAEEPVRVIDILNKEAHYFKCPAIINYFKNVFAIKAPCNMQLYVNKTTNEIWLKATDTDIHLDAITFHKNSKDTISISIPSLTFVTNEKNLEIEQLPPSMHPSELSSKVSFFSGTFEISSWVRPVEVALVLNEDITEVFIPKGTVLTYVKFKTKSDVKLVKVDATEIDRVVQACLFVKQFIKAHNLKNLYLMYKNSYNKKKWKI